jgi:hypothetical protein
MKTLAEKYIEKAQQLMPAHEELWEGIKPSMTEGQIDEEIFHRGEYLGGMAAVILELI